MKNANWQNDEPTQKQIDLFNSLKLDFKFDGKEPKTKGEYREAIGQLMQKQNVSVKYNIQRDPRNIDWMKFYDDDYLGDQGIFPGY